MPKNSMTAKWQQGIGNWTMPGFFDSDIILDFALRISGFLSPEAT